MDYEGWNHCLGECFFARKETPRGKVIYLAVDPAALLRAGRRQQRFGPLGKAVEDFCRAARDEIDHHGWEPTYPLPTTAEPSFKPFLSPRAKVCLPPRCWPSTA